MSARPRGYRDDPYGEAGYREDVYRDDPYRGPYEPPREAYDDRRFDDAAYEGGEYAYGGRHAEPVERMRPARLEPLQRSAASTLRAAQAGRPNGEQRELDSLFGDGPLQKITTLRPSDYSEARTIGERYRDGSPVIMDLVDMSNDDAKRLVDFAAGLAFALRGSFDKVATKVFLLSPADVDVSPEDRRKIAASGFYNHG